MCVCTHSVGGSDLALLSIGLIYSARLAHAALSWLLSHSGGGNRPALCAGIVSFCPPSSPPLSTASRLRFSISWQLRLFHLGQEAQAPTHSKLSTDATSTGTRRPLFQPNSDRIHTRISRLGDGSSFNALLVLKAQQKRWVMLSQTVPRIRYVRGVGEQY